MFLSIQTGDSALKLNNFQSYKLWPQNLATHSLSVKQAIFEFPGASVFKQGSVVSLSYGNDFFIFMHIKLIFTRKLELRTWRHFESEGFWNSEVIDLFIREHLT